MEQFMVCVWGRWCSGAGTWQLAFGIWPMWLFGFVQISLDHSLRSRTTSLRVLRIAALANATEGAAPHDHITSLYVSSTSSFRTLPDRTL
jgi:hypothetical protein